MNMHIGCTDNGDHTCGTHGGEIQLTAAGRVWCQTVTALQYVAAERHRQFKRYGTNADLPDGTGPTVEWVPVAAAAAGADAVGLEQGFRADYELAEEQGRLSWMHLVREEVAEAFLEEDPYALRDELVQVAALAVSWVEKLDDRLYALELEEAEAAMDGDWHDEAEAIDWR